MSQMDSQKILFVCNYADYTPAGSQSKAEHVHKVLVQLECGVQDAALQNRER